MDIQLFNSPQFGNVRTAGTPGEPLFCLADICRVLELQTGATKNRLDQRGVSLVNTPTSSGVQPMVYINEKNLYKVIMRSDKPQAEDFQDWVCGEVLPSIRKTGRYDIRNMSRKELALEIIKAEEEKEALLLENKRKEEQLEEQKPKVVFAEAIVGSQTSCLIGELAKLICQNGYEIGEKRLFAWMRANHYLGTTGEYYNIPYQKYIEMGLFDLKRNVHSQNGHMVTTVTPKVTGKGQQYFINKFLGGK